MSILDHSILDSSILDTVHYTETKNNKKVKINQDLFDDWKEYKKYEYKKYYETERVNPVNMMKNLSEILRRTK